jgi:hypothetical protein
MTKTKLKDSVKIILNICTSIFLLQEQNKFLPSHNTETSGKELITLVFLKHGT